MCSAAESQFGIATSAVLCIAVVCQRYFAHGVFLHVHVWLERERAWWDCADSGFLHPAD